MAACGPVGAGLDVVAGKGGVEGGGQHRRDHVRLPAHQDLQGRGVRQRGGGCEQSGRGRVAAVDRVVGRGWEEREVERLRGGALLVLGRAGEALVLGEW